MTVLSIIGVVLGAIAVALSPVAVAKIILKARARKNLDRLRREAYLAEEKKEEEREERWIQQVEKNRHLLVGETWRNPCGKAEFVSALYGDKIPDYLWYSLGQEIRLASSEDDDGLELERIIKTLFLPGENLSFGDIEFYHSAYPEAGLLLRIRNAKNFASEIRCNGNIFPLYQIGNAEMFSQVGCVNFFILQAMQLAD